jgi:hypothetical protein
LLCHLGLDFAGGFALGCIGWCRGHSPGQPLPVSVEVLTLGGNGLTGFARIDLFRSLCIREIKNGPSLDAVDVAANERLRVGSQHGDQHLIERDPAWLVCAGEFACCVANLDGHGAFLH